MLRYLGIKFRQLLQFIPASVVVADGQCHWGKWSEILQKPVADLAVQLGAFPVELVDQVVVGVRRGDPDVMQHTEIEQEKRRIPVQAHCLPTGGSHRANALAVANIVNTNQIQSIRKRIDNVAQVDGQGRRSRFRFRL